ncbi:lectin-like domain-containing protein, partial [Flavobacterium alkalisoli]|uniref:L-type lectin-domain containing protein n=1 Tax=Flavobacterium alkalisoli TaxID=2602769 RepID=UPI003A946EE1
MISLPLCKFAEQSRILLFGICLLFTTSVFAQLTPTFVNNASQMANGCYRITNNAQSNSGAVWYNNPIDLSNDFEIVFNAYFGANSNGADGMTFVLKTTANPVIGIIGGGLGYRDLPDQPSLAVEFDTYRNVNASNGLFVNDPLFDHVALQKAGNISHASADNLVAPVQASPTSTNIKDNTEHEVKIRWRASTQAFTVIFDCSERFTYLGDLINDVFGGTSNVYFGFTGSTGGQANLQYICFQYLSFLDAGIQDKLICAGASVDDIDGSYTGASTYQWTPTTGVSNPNIAAPVFTPTETTTYLLTVTDNCGDVMEHEFTITVADFEASVTAVESPVCNGTGEAQFAIMGEPNAEVAYTINNGAEETVFLDDTGAALVTVSDVTVGQTLQLVNLTVAEEPFCTVPLTESAFVDVTLDDASFYLNPGCTGATATVTGVSGGVFTFDVTPGDGAIIDETTGEISNAVPGATYSVQYLTNGTCPNTNVEQVTLYLLPTISSPITDYVLCDQTDYMTPDGIEEFDLTTK